MMTEEVKIASSEGDEDAESKKVCPLCLKAQAKYTCPRCNSPYCSVDCYRSEKHMNCSESFYKDCFMEGLKDCNADPSEKHKVMEMLKRAEADPGLGDDLDNDLEDDLHERLDDLDLDRDIDKVWDRLTVEEQRDFEAMTGDGRLGNLLQVWTPWWAQSNAFLVTELKPEPTEQKSPKNSPTETPSDDVAPPPTIADTIPNISEILKVKPSADVKYNVINVLYCYVFVSRLHNGDHVTMATESVRDFLELSEILEQNHSCGSVDEAIQSCLRRLIRPNNSFETTPEWNISMIRDVEQIVSQGMTSKPNDPLHMILCAMSDVYAMFKAAHKVSVKRARKEGNDVKGKEKLTEEKKKLFHCVKKIEFMLSWCQTYGMALIGLVPEIEMIYSLLVSEYEAMDQSRKTLESQWGGNIKPRRRKLVEEV